MHAWTPPTDNDTRDNPAEVRPGYGDESLHVWWPLTDAEKAVLAAVPRAKEGDAHALLALAIMASGDERDASKYEGYQQRFDKEVADLKPTVDGAADDWHRGYEVNRALHRVFFTGEKNELGSYRLDQAHVTGIFETGTYNCISSAMLYIALARAFNLPVRGVIVPTHAFVEMGQPGGKILEVETTTNTGFDWVHDAKFFAENAEKWSASRGLRPVTLDDYQHRQILQPYELMAHAMIDRRAGRTDDDRHRLAELAGVVDPDDPELVRNRMIDYVNEAIELEHRKASRTLAHMFDVLAPAISDIAGRAGKDAGVMAGVAWLTYYYANALVVVGRGAEAEPLANEALDHFDAAWKDADKLKPNLLSVLVDRMLLFHDKKDYAHAVAVMSKHMADCQAQAYCLRDVYIVYDDWYTQKQVAGDWPGARDVLTDCVRRLPGETKCAEELKVVVSEHKL